MSRNFDGPVHRSSEKLELSLRFMGKTLFDCRVTCTLPSLFCSMCLPFSVTFPNAAFPFFSIATNASARLEARNAASRSWRGRAGTATTRPVNTGIDRINASEVSH